MQENQVPVQFGNYRVVRAISEGASSHVYLVERDGAKLALKHWKTVDEGTMVRFRRESASLARLSHENLVKIHDIGEQDGRPYLVMEFLEGATLDTETSEASPTPHAKATRFARRVAQALAELHHHNLVHRDVKPTNILVTTGGDVRLIDLGLIGDVDQIKGETALVGTPLYCSPEQARALRRPVDFRSDLYSLGATLFHLLTGRPPFLGTLSEILHQHAAVPAPDPRELRKDVPPSLCAIIAKLLAKDPDDRYQSANGLLHDLDRLEEIDANLRRGAKPGLGSRDRATLTSRVKFVEKKAEAEALRDAWARASGGTPGLVIVSGESGCGKTRLCDEFIASATNEGSLILRAKCQAFDRFLPFGPVREALDNLLEEIHASPEDARAEALATLRSAAVGHEAKLIHLSKSFRGVLSGEAAPAGSHDNVEVDREAFFAGVAEFFARLLHFGRRKALLFIDDLQWIDEASLHLLDAVLEKASTAGFLLLGTARSDATSREYLQGVEATLGARIAGRIEVTLFTEAQTGALVAGCLGSAEIEAEVTRTIFQRSKGNAFVAMEYVRAGIEQGFLSFKDRVWRLDRAALAAIVLSDNVYDLIVRRVEAVSSEARLFLQYAAVYANVFRPSDIVRAAGLDAAAAERLLRHCEELALIERATPLKWRFIHDKIPESMLASMPEAARAAACATLAELLFARAERTPDELFIMARLFAKAAAGTSMERAIEAHVLAGEHAVENYAYREAHVFLKFAWERLGGTDRRRRGQIAVPVAISAAMAGDDALALESIDLYLAGARGAERVHALGIKVWILTSQNSITGAWEHFKHACHLLGRAYPDYLHWKLLHVLWNWAASIVLELAPVRLPARLFFRQDGISVNKVAAMYREATLLCELRGNTLDLMLVSLRLLVMGQITGGAKEKAVGYSCVGFLYGSFGLRRLAVIYFARAREYAEMAQDPSVLALYEMRRLFGFFYCGLLDDYQKEYQEKRDLLNRFLSPGELGRFLVMSGYFYGFRGMHNEAIQALSGHVEAAEKGLVRLPRYAVTSCLNQLWTQLNLVGRAQEAQQIRASAMSRMNKLRYCPPISRGAMASEIGIRRITEELGQTTEEIVTCFWRRCNNTLVDPIHANHAAHLSFIRLYQLARAKSFEDRFSARLELNQMIRHMHFSLYCPLFRANYHVIRGGLYRLNGSFGAAERQFGRAERIAAKFRGFRTLFDVQRERARIHEARQETELMRLNLVAAADLAAKHDWKPGFKVLQAEFGAHVTAFRGSEGSAAAARETSHGGSQTVVASSASRTTMGSVSGADPSSARLINALLNVAAAFTTTVNPAEQAKSVLKEVIRLFSAERGFMFAMDPATRELTMVGAKNAKGLDIEHLANYSRTMVRRAIAERRAVVLSGSDEAQAMGAESAVLHNLRSVMVTPLLLKDEVIGVVYLDSTLSRGLFSEEDADLFRTLANQIAVAFELTRMTQVELEKANLQKALDIQSAISTEARKVKILVDNMQQALFSVSANGVIQEPVSRYSGSVFEAPVAGEKLMDLLRRGAIGERDKLDAIDTVMNCVYGEDSLQWELIEDSLPRRLSYRAPAPHGGDGQDKVLKVLPSPIWDEQDKLERILFVVEDITHLVRLECEVAEQRLQAELLRDILATPADDLRRFLRSAERVLAVLAAFGDRAGDSASRQEAARDLHTLKGMARMHRLERLATAIHDAESRALPALTSTSSPAELAAVLAAEATTIGGALESYRQLFVKIFPDAGSAAPTHELALAQLRAVVDELGGQLPDAGRERLRRAVQRLTFRSVRAVAERFKPMVDEISAKLGKEVELQIQGDALLNEDAVATLNECLIHLVRNSLDHGIEAKEERARAKKPARGKIAIRLASGPDGTELSISDDGRGLDGERIARSAVAKGIITEAAAGALSEQEKIKLIFLPGFSTREAATEVSGRGVGMDVVQSNVVKIGGSIRIDTEVGSGTTFSISLAA